MHASLFANQTIKQQNRKKQTETTDTIENHDNLYSTNN